MIPYFHALLIQRHGMISALMIYGRKNLATKKCGSALICECFDRGQIILNS